MPVDVLPTLEVMARVYGLSTVGGAVSERFTAYVRAAEDGAPIHGYNPMTSKPVGDTVLALVAIGAEERLAAAADAAAARLGCTDDLVMHWTVATPGMWTDRLATEVEHRLLARDPGGVLWWFDEPVRADAVEAEVAAQTVRLVQQRSGRAPATLADAVRQEGCAAMIAGATGHLDPGASDALSILGDDTGLGTMVAFLYGDEAARAMGFTPLGLGHRVGYRHAIALAHAHASRS